MDIIFCLVGPSGSGKTTVAKELSKDYNVIQSYTTREKRSEDEWGHTFVDEYKPARNIIAYNLYNGNHYWATTKQYEGMGKTIYIIDPKGDEVLRDTIDTKIVTIFLSIPTTEAYRRMIVDRSEEAVWERLEYDEKEFAVVKTDWVVTANCHRKVLVEKVKAIINSY